MLVMPCWLATEIAVVRVTPIVKDLVLVGGGHAHVHVLKSFGMKPVPGVRITLVARDVETPYSGMLPGFIAGHYTREQCHIDLRPLARFAGARLIHDEAIGLDLAGRRVLCRDAAAGRLRRAVDRHRLDAASGLHSGRRRARHAGQADRPAGGAVGADRGARESAATQPVRFLTVGGGAAGVELTLAMRHRLRGLLRERGARSGQRRLHAGHARGDPGRPQCLGAPAVPQPARDARRRRRREQRRRGRWRTGPCSAPTAQRIGFDELIWVTEAGAASWLADTGLALDAGGFIEVDATLRSLSDAHVFAAGDVAANVEHPRPKAGVFAVRQGPPLADNLRRALAGQPLVPFVPQRKFLSLISTGDRCAVASRGRLAAQGPILWRLKDWIDRRWMRPISDAG